MDKIKRNASKGKANYPKSMPSKRKKTPLYLGEMILSTSIKKEACQYKPL